MNLKVSKLSSQTSLVVFNDEYPTYEMVYLSCKHYILISET